MSSLYGEVQRQDWQDRDFINIISKNIKKISDFLNQFDQSCRGKLADLNEKVTNLERRLEFLEASINGAANQASQTAALLQADPKLQSNSIDSNVPQ